MRLRVSIMASCEIIIVNWNGLPLLKQCLASLECQSVRDFSVTVVDNASEDGSLQWLQQNQPSVKRIALDQNVGFAKANNLAAFQSTAEYLLLLNNDIEVEPNFIQAIQEGLKRNPDADMVSVLMIQHRHRDRVDNKGMDWTWAGIARQRGHGSPVQRVPRTDEWIFGPSAGAGVYRRDLFLQLQGFDESFFAYCEDSDLNLRARAVQARCVFLPQAICYHHGSATGDRNSALKYYLIQRNQSISFMKNLRRCRLGRYVIPYLAYCVVRGLQSVFSGRLPIFIRAKRDALRMVCGRGCKVKDTQGS